MSIENIEGNLWAELGKVDKVPQSKWNYWFGGNTTWIQNNTNLPAIVFILPLGEERELKEGEMTDALNRFKHKDGKISVDWPTAQQTDVAAKTMSYITQKENGGIAVIFLHDTVWKPIWFGRFDMITQYDIDPKDKDKNENDSDNEENIVPIY